jgi:MFS family permease
MGRLEANIWKIYLYRFLNEFWLIVPVLIPFYKSNELNSTQIFVIQAAYALSILILEIPSGYLADIIGRKKTLLLGAAFLPLGVAIYAFSETFILFLLAEFTVAVGNSMRSGSDAAMVYDTLIQLKRESDYKKVEGRSAFYTRIGTSSSSILGGLLALLVLRLPFYVNIITGLMMLPIATSMIEPGREKIRSPRPYRDILRIFRFSLSHSGMRFYILYGALVMSTGVVGVWSYFLYYESLGINLFFFGLIFAVFMIASALGSRYAHLVEKKIGEKRSLYLSLLIGPSFILLGLFKSVFLIPFILMNSFLWGMTYPLVSDAINRQIKSDVRATVLSVSNMTVSFSFVILSPLFGKIVDLSNLSTAYLIMGAYFLLYASSAFFFRKQTDTNRIPS